MAETDSRGELLAALGEQIITIFRQLQPEVTVPREGLIHVTRSEADIMRILMQAPGSTVTDIARSFGQHKSNTSTRVAALVEKGLARKAAAEVDGREVLVFPTPAAIANLEKYRGVWAEHLDPVAPSETEQLRIAVEVLHRIADGLEAAGSRRGTAV